MRRTIRSKGRTSQSAAIAAASILELHLFTRSAQAQEASGDVSAFQDIASVDGVASVETLDDGSVEITMQDGSVLTVPAGEVQILNGTVFVSDSFLIAQGLTAASGNTVLLLTLGAVGAAVGVNALESSSDSDDDVVPPGATPPPPPPPMPPVFTSSASASVAENQADAYRAVATDADSDTLSYSLSGTDADRFMIDAATGEVRFIEAPDFEAPGDADADNVYDIIVTASDGANTAERTVAIMVTDENDPPIFTSDAAVSVAENQTVAYTALATDADGDDLSYSLSGTDAALFMIDATTGEVRFIEAPDFEAPGDADGDNVYDIVVTASDGTISTDQAVAITVTDETDITAFERLLDDPGGASVADFEAAGIERVDARTLDAVRELLQAVGEDDPATLASLTPQQVQAIAGMARDHIVSITGPEEAGLYDSGEFTLGPNPAIVSVEAVPFIVALDYDGDGETDHIVTIEFDADYRAQRIERDFGADNGPDDSPDVVEVVEHLDERTIRISYDIRGDGDTDRIETYTLDANGDRIRIDVDTDADGNTDRVESYEVDADGNRIQIDFDSNADGEIDRTELDGDADGNPDRIETYTFDENGNRNRIRTDFDNDSDGTINRAEFDDDADGVTDRSEIYTYDASGNRVRTDFDDNNDGIIDRIESYTLDASGNRVRTNSDDDADGNIDRVEFDDDADGAIDRSEIYTYDENGRRVRTDFDDNNDGTVDRVEFNDNTPIFTSAATVRVAENQTVAYRAVATDADGDTLSYSLSGTDGALFTINPATGEVSFVAAPDFENPGDADGDNVYDIVVTASDGTNSMDQTVAITVTDENEVDNPPIFTSPDSASLAENQSPDTAVYTAMATNADGGDPTYSLSGTDAALFTINAATGEVRFIAAPDFEDPDDTGADNVYDIVVTASDGSNDTSQPVTITVTNVNDNPPIFTSPDSASVAENQTLAYTAVAADADGGAPTYSLSGTDASLFTIDPTTGDVSFITPPDFENPGDASGNNVYDIVVTASDSSNDTNQAVAITVTDVNDNPPIFTSAASASVAENQSADTVIYTAMATDADGDDLSYSLSGTDAALFMIDATTGEVRFIEAPDFEAPGDADGDNVYDIVVTASDGTISTDQAVAITVTDETDITAFERLLDDPGGASVADFEAAGIERVDARTLDAVRELLQAVGEDDPATLASLTPQQVQAIAGMARDHIVSITGPEEAGLYDSGEFTLGPNPAIVSVEAGPFIVALDYDGDGETDHIVNIEFDADYRAQRIERDFGADNGPDDSPDVVEVVEHLDERTIRISYDIRGDGDTDRIETYTLDANGDRIRIDVDTDADGNTDRVESYEVDAGGNRIQIDFDSNADGEIDRTELDGDADGNPDRIETYTFDENGNRNRIRTDFDNDSDGSIDRAEFDDDADGVTDRSEIYTYDASGNRVRTDFDDDADGVTDRSEIYTYDASGNRVRTDFDDNNDGIIDRIESYTLDASGNRVRTNSDDDADGNIDRVEFDDDADGAIDRSEIYTYDENGRRVRTDFDDNNDGIIDRVEFNDNTPIFTSAATVRVAENQTVAYRAVATDADGDTLSYSLSGTDGALFTINPATGEVSFVAAPDFENPGDADGDNVYDIVVTASDGTNSMDQTVAITVTDENEVDNPPIFTSPDSASVAENQSPDTAVYTAMATNADGGDPTYSLSGTDAALFTINAATGEVRFIAAPDFEDPDDTGADNVYDIVVTASDGSNDTSQPVTITVTNVNDNPPIFTSPDSASVAENQTLAYTAVAADADGGAPTYSLSGTDASLFTIDPTTGDVSFITPPDFENPGDASGNNVYDIVVTASDSSNDTNQAVAITVTDVNDNPPIFTSAASASVAENQSADTVIYTAMATDADGDDLSYSLSGTDAALFMIDATTGEVRFIEAPDFEAPGDADGDNVYDIVVTASDGTISTDQAVAITVTDETDITAFERLLDDPGGASVADFEAAGIERVDARTLDAVRELLQAVGEDDPATLAALTPQQVQAIAGMARDHIVSITGPEEAGLYDSGEFTLGPNPAIVSVEAGPFIVALDYDGDGETDHIVNIEFDADYRAQRIERDFGADNGPDDSPDVVEVVEHLDERTIRISYDIRGDGDTDRIETYTLDANGDRIRIDVDTDADGNTDRVESYEVDAGGNRIQIDFDSNADGEIDRTELDGDADGNPDRIETYTFDENGNRNRIRTDFDNDSDGSIDRAEFDDDADGVTDRSEIYTYDASGNRVRTDFDDDADGVTDRSEIYTYDASGNRVRTDFDDGADGTIDRSEIYTLDANGNRVRTDFDDNNDGIIDRIESYTLDASGNRVRTNSDDDADGNIDRVEFDDDADGAIDRSEIYIYDENGRRVRTDFDDNNDGIIDRVEFNDNTPIFTSAATVRVAENQTVAYRAVATDADGDTLSYSLSGTDGALFTINPATGEVSFVAAPDFENPGDADGDNVYDIVVTASDGTNSMDQTVAITVTDENEVDNPPIFTSPDSASVAENQSPDTAVYTAMATNADGGDPTYSLSGTDAALFTINAATGEVRFIAAPDFEDPDDTGADNVYDIVVTASDGSNDTSQPVTITVTNVNDNPPIFTSPDSASVAENQTLAYTAVAADADGGAPTYSLSGTDASLFTIDPTTGDVSFITPPDFENPGDASGNNVYDIVVTASDGSNDTNQAVAITVTDVNDNPPIFTSADSASVAENQSADTVIYTAMATDADGDDLSYSLSGTDAALFMIDATTGEVSFIEAPDFEAPGDTDGDNVYDIVVTASDGTISTDQAVAITVTDETDITAFERLLDDPGGASVADFEAAGIERVDARTLDAVRELLQAVGEDDPATLASLTPQQVQAIAGMARDHIVSITGPEEAGIYDSGEFTLGPNPAIVSVEAVPFIVALDYDGDGETDHIVNIEFDADYRAQRIERDFGADNGPDDSPDVVEVVEHLDERTIRISYDIRGDGDTDRIETYTLDANGDRIRIDVDTDADGNTDQVESYEVDADGNRIQIDFDSNADGEIDRTELDGDADGNPDRIETYTFDENGNRNRIRTDFDNDSDGTIDRAEFDDDADGVTDRSEIYTYDASGNRVRTDFDDDADGTIDRSEIYTLDANGNRVRTDFDDNNDGIIDRIESYTLDASGNRVRTNSDDDADGNIDRVEFDDDADGAIDRSEIYTYDENGRRVRTDFDDNNDGIIDRVEFHDNTPIDNTPIDNTPIFTSAATVRVAENQTVAYRAVATDADGDTLSYSLSGTDGALFTINPATGEVSFVAAPDFENPGDADGDNVYDIVVTASDGTNSMDQTVAITVTDENEVDNPPIFTSPDSASVAENQSPDTAVYTAMATDADGGDPTYSLSGTDAALFTINAATGEVRFIAAPDFEDPDDTGADNVYDIVVTASDGSNDTSQPVTITVTNVNDNPPIFTSPDSASVAENQTLAYTAVAADADGGAPTYSLSGTDASLFTIDPTTGDVSFITPPDFENPGDASGNNVYDIVVTASDSSNDTNQAVAITVTDVNDNPPIFTSAASASVAENQSADTVIYTAMATDADGDAPTYSLSGTDASLFTIDPTTGDVSFIAAPDFEDPDDTGADNVYEIVVTASDGSNDTSQPVAITVTDVNDNPPIFTSPDSASVAENQRLAYTAVATDADEDPLTYNLSGTDAALFTIDPATGAVSFIAAPDFENPDDAGGDNVYDIVVTASDGSNDRNQAVAITVTDENEIGNPPIFTSATSASVAENQTVDSVVYTAVATDGDGDALTYSLSGTDAARFTINATTGAVRFIASPDFENPGDAGGNNAYEILVTASDGSNDINQVVAITVTDVNDNSPIFTSPDSASVAENQRLAYTAVATDADGDPLTYSLSGTDAALFTIDPAMGVVSFIEAPDFENPDDAGGNNVYDIVVTASDGSNDTNQPVAITVTNVNDNSPVFTSPATASVEENQTAAYTVVATDADGDPLTYSLSGTDAGLFTIDPATGVVSFNEAPDAENPDDANGDNVYDIVVTASDNTEGTPDTNQSVAITVTGVNDNAPIFTSPATANVEENQTAAYTAVAMDGDGRRPTTPAAPLIRTRRSPSP